MNKIDLITQDVTAGFSNLFKTGFQKATQWAGYTVSWISRLPVHMQQNPKVAGAVIISTNLIFFSLINLIANRLEKRLRKSSLLDSPKQKLIGYVVINGCVAGGLTLLANLSFAKLTNYPLSPLILTAITLASLVVRTLVTTNGCWAKQTETENSETDILEKRKKYPSLFANRDKIQEELKKLRASHNDVVSLTPSDTSKGKALEKDIGKLEQQIREIDYELLD